MPGKTVTPPGWFETLGGRDFAFLDGGQSFAAAPLLMIVVVMIAFLMLMGAASSR